MKRGQAFETMMLVISVIVALAILAVLLNIIGGITIAGNGADKLMHDQLKDVVSKGYGFASANTATFAAGSRITIEQILEQDITTVLPSEVDFVPPLSPDPLADAFTVDKPTGSGQILDVVKKVDATFVVCGNINANTATSPIKYHISIARTAADAAKYCLIPA